MRRNRLKRSALTLVWVLVCASISSVAWAGVVLGSAETFAVLGYSTVTNAGLTTLVGDLGSSEGAGITGFYATNLNSGPGTFTGTSYEANPYAKQARADAATASNYLNSLTATETLSGKNLGGLTLTPGVYLYDTSAALTGNLILDGAGDYVFKIGSTLTAAPNSSISFINGANPYSDVFWNVGSSATLQYGTTFGGTIISTASNTLGAGASVAGRVIALGGAVTLDNNNIVSAASPASPAVPEPSTLLFMMAVGGLAMVRRRRTVWLWMTSKR